GQLLLHAVGPRVDVGGPRAEGGGQVEVELGGHDAEPAGFGGEVAARLGRVRLLRVEVAQGRERQRPTVDAAAEEALDEGEVVVVLTPHGDRRGDVGEADVGQRTRDLDVQVGALAEATEDLHDEPVVE